MRTEHGNGELDQLKICHTDQIYEAVISKDSQFRAEIWHVLSASINMSCYFWCQDNAGNYKNDHHHDTTLNLALPPKVSNIGFESDSKIIPLSNGQAYLFELDTAQCHSQEICYDTLRFKWHSPFTCQVHLACSSLTGNICGDYGFELITAANQSVAICHPNKIYDLKLTSMQTLDLTFWHTDDNKEFEASCYLWCGNTGQQFINASSVVHYETLESQKMTFLQQTDLEAPVLFSLEPNKVQKMSFSWTNDICQVTQMCVKTANFAWLQPTQCQLNLYCPVLQGDICSLAGLDAKSRHFNASICQANMTYQHYLSAHDVLTLTFWHTPLATFYVECYAWCNTNQHQTPDKNQWRTMHISTANNSTCQGNCSLEQTFHSKLQGTCLASFQCDLLSGDPCLTYGLDVSFPHSGLNETFASVCIEHSVVLGKLEFNQSVIIRMWYDTATTDLKKADCKLWCSNHIEDQNQPKKVRF